jgi:hypothetical protein
MQLKFYHQSIFGQHRWIPNCKNSKCLATIARRKTFSPDILCTLRDNGYEIKTTQSPNVKIDDKFIGYPNSGG